LTLERLLQSCFTTALQKRGKFIRPDAQLAGELRTAHVLGSPAYGY
jgi:hypothetical protein